MNDLPKKLKASLKIHRESIDRLDAIIVYTLAERFKHTEEIGKIKAKNNLEPSDPKREAEQIDRLHRLSKDADLNEEFAKRLLAFIIEEVIRHHKDLQ